MSFASNGPNSQEGYTIQSGKTSTDVFITIYQTRDPTPNDVNYPVKKRWINLADPDNIIEWILKDYTNATGETLANWLVVSRNDFIATITGDDGVIVSPDVDDNIDLLGNVVANQTYPKPVYTDSPGSATENVNVQVAAAISATDINRVGLAAFLDTQFDVDPNGFVSLVGGTNPAVQNVQVDVATLPGTDPVVADVNGTITVTGGQIAAETTANVLRTNSVLPNQYAVEVQRSTAKATSTVASNGVSHFNSAQFSVDANGFVSTLGSSLVPGAQNLGFTYSAGVFTMTAADGTALSATNPAYVVVPSATSRNTFKRIAITAPQSFNDSASGGSTLVGNTWGTTAGRAWPLAMPFYVYAVLNSQAGENAIAFAIGRIPNLTLSPAAARLARQGSAVATTQGSLYLMPAVTVADYQNSGLICLGSFRVVKTAANDWTVQTLDNGDGIGTFNESRAFIFPTGQNGASLNSYFRPNGGTAPVSSAGNTNSGYNINRYGETSHFLDLQPPYSTNGAGAVNLTPTIPYIYGLNSTSTSNSLYLGAPSSIGVGYVRNPSPIDSTTGPIYSVAGGAAGILQNADVTTALNTNFQFKFIYIVDTA